MKKPKEIIIYDGHAKCITEVPYDKLETLAAKVTELEEKIKNTQYNLELRTQENHDIINNHDESRWTYWRKRSGEMTDAWRDQRDSALTLTAKVKRYEEVIEAALRLQDLWLYTGKITVEHASEAQALNLMKRNFEAALNQGED